MWRAAAPSCLAGRWRKFPVSTIFRAAGCPVEELPLPRLAATLHTVAELAQALADGPQWPARQALVSLHDVTPAHGDVIFRAIDHLRQRGVSALTLLVVPDYHYRAGLRDHPAFCARLRQALRPADEVVLHGYHHLADRTAKSVGGRLAGATMTAGEGEFQALGFAEAKARILQGISDLRSCLDVDPIGFIAPAWLQNREVVRAVKATGLAWCEDHVFLYNLRTGAQILAPALSLASRDLLRRAGSQWLAAASAPLLPGLRTVRLAVHPGDFAHKSLVATLDGVLARWLPSHPPTTVRAVWPERLGP